MEEKLSIETLQAILEHLPVGFALWRIEDINNPGTWRLVLGNAEYNKASGIDWKDFYGKTLRESFRGALETNVPEIWKKAAITGEEQQMPDLDYSDNNVVRGIFAIRVIPIGSEYICQILKNITTEKKVQKELNKKMEELQTMNSFMVDRENKMVELKREIENLKKSQSIQAP